MSLRVVTGSMRAQFQMTSRDIEDLLPLVTMPLFTLVFMAVFIYTGRRDLLGYALVAPLLMTIAQMGLIVASELITRDRSGQTLEPIVATPAPFFLVLASRITVPSALGLVGFVEAWLIARLLFGVTVTIHHPGVLAVTLVLTMLAATGTALVTAALFCFSRSARTLQASVAFPLFVIAGVLVPVTFLPVWIQPVSRVIFLYWSADLLRDAMQPAAIEGIAFRLGMIALLGLAGAVIGAVLIQRMLQHLKREGTLGMI
jgi:ABC-2 type transport system permease protein